MALLEDHRPSVRAARWPGASDAALTRGAAAGDEGAFTEVFARYHAPLVRYCRGILLDDDIAQDAAQNALTNALRALREGRSLPHALGPWLYRIAQREAVDLARRRSRDAARRAGGAHDDGGHELLMAVPAPSDERVRDRLRELVGDLARLPLRQRSALLLRELSGLGYAEIAIALDTTPQAARQSVLEARHALAAGGDGRRESCGAIRALVDGGDRRRLRGRRVRAHLDACAPCTAFAATIAARRRDLALLFPIGPAVALASGGGAFAALTGGGAAAGGGAVAASGWSLGLGGLGASGAAKCAAVCATAAIVGVGSLTDQAPRPAPERPAVVAQVPQGGAAEATAAGTAAARAATATAAARASSRAPKAASSSPSSVKDRTVTRGTVQASSTVRRERSQTRPATSGLPSSSPSPKAAKLAGPTTTAPTMTVTTAPTVPDTAPVSTSTPSGPTARQQLALELQRRTQEAVAAATASTAQTVQQSTAAAQAVTQTAVATAQAATTAAVSGVQTQLDLVRRLLQPQG